MISEVCQYFKYSHARDLARFGLLVLSEGKWNGHAILNNSKYLLESLQPSQKLKPSYAIHISTC